MLFKLDGSRDRLLREGGREGQPAVSTCMNTTYTIVLYRIIIVLDVESSCSCSCNTTVSVNKSILYLPRYRNGAFWEYLI